MPQKPQVLDYDSVVPIGRRGKEPEASESETEVSFTPNSEEALPRNTLTNQLEKSGRDEERLASARKAPVCKRGHAVTFAALFIFSVILYFRPYELIPALSSLTSMAFYAGIVTLTIYAVTQLGLEGNLTARPYEVNLVLLLG